MVAACSGDTDDCCAVFALEGAGAFTVLSCAHRTRTPLFAALNSLSFGFVLAQVRVSTHMEIDANVHPFAFRSIRRCGFDDKIVNSEAASSTILEGAPYGSGIRTICLFNQIQCPKSSDLAN